MRIDAVDLFHVAMPLISPWRTAYGEDAVIESVLVRMEGEGRTAWGEASPLAAPLFSYASAPPFNTTRAPFCEATTPLPRLSNTTRDPSASVSTAPFFPGAISAACTTFAGGSVRFVFVERR